MLRDMHYSSKSPFIGMFNARWILSILLIVVWVASSMNRPNFGFSDAGGIQAFGFNAMHALFLPGLAVLFFYIGYTDYRKKK